VSFRIFTGESRSAVAAFWAGALEPARIIAAEQARERKVRIVVPPFLDSLIPMIPWGPEKSDAASEYLDRGRTPRQPIVKVQPSLSTSARVAVIVAITLACLAPFVGKAVHIDDYLFLRAAERIRETPLDPYGVRVNWYGTQSEMAEVMKNPPLHSYFLAAAAAVGLSGDVGLHVASLLPALGAAIGTFLLARRLTRHPLLATLAGILTPVFLISSTGLMCDVTMLASWVLSLLLWILASDRKSTALFLLAGGTIAACALTKYFGIALIPLVAVYSLARERRVGRWIVGLLPAVGILALYQGATASAYGRGLLLDAVSYASSARETEGPRLETAFVGLVFAGGCTLTVHLLAPIAWRGLRALVAGAVALAVPLAVLVVRGRFGGFDFADAEGIRWIAAVPLAVFAAAGVHAAALAVRDLSVRRDAESILLGLWLFGTLAFASLFNWTVAARSVLPLAPVAAILLARAMDRSAPRARPPGRRAVVPYLLLIPGAALALGFTWADFRLAGSVREAAGEIRRAAEGDAGKLWFLGHWGFQHYMEEAGADPVDSRRSVLRPGDLLAIPRNNTNILTLPTERLRRERHLAFVPSRRMATMDATLGAGFYSSIWGPAPFAFGRAAPEEYLLFRVVVPIDLRAP
jgi:hypothetical protein